MIGSRPLAAPFEANHTGRVARCYSEILTQAERRWTALGVAHPTMAPAIALQRLLVSELMALLERLEDTPAMTPPSNPATMAAKLRRGLPALRGEPIAVPVPALAPSLDRFCHYLADSGAGDVARHVIEILESGRMSRASLLSASLARDQRAIRMGATQMGLSPDVVWLIAELATAPLAHILQERLFGQEAEVSGSETLQSARAEWDRGYCPACGSWPVLAEYVNEVRRLRCSFCGTSWEMQSRRCAYCGEGGAAFSICAADEKHPEWLVELCAQCGGYTKGVKVAASTPFLLLALQDLETFALDRIAADRGYGRPPLVDLGAEATYEPPRPCEQ